MIRKIGLWACLFGFVGMLVAFSVGNVEILIIEAAMMVTGAVLSLHPKPQPATPINITAAFNPPSSADLK